MNVDAVDIDIAREAGDWSDDAEEIVLKAARAALDDAFPPEDAPAEMSIVLGDDALVQRLNRDYRGKDKPTNVLSFAFADNDSEPETDPDAPIMLGDIVLSVDTLRREAAEQSKPFDHHLAHLVVHGVLHLLGYDHEGGAEEAEAMESLEAGILAGLSIPNPYDEPRDGLPKEPRQQRS